MFIYDLLYAIFVLSLGIVVIFMLFVLFIYLCKEGWFDNFAWYIRIKLIINNLSSSNNFMKILTPFLMNDTNLGKNKTLSGSIDRVKISVNGKQYNTLIDTQKLKKDYRVYLELNDGRLVDLELLPGHIYDINVKQITNAKQFILKLGVKIIKKSENLQDLYII